MLLAVGLVDCKLVIEYKTWVAVAVVVPAASIAEMQDEQPPAQEVKETKKVPYLTPERREEFRKQIQVNLDGQRPAPRPKRTIVRDPSSRKTTSYMTSFEFAKVRTPLSADLP